MLFLVVVFILLIYTGTSLIYQQPTWITCLGLIPKVIIQRRVSQ